MARAAFQMSLVNPHVKSEVTEVNEFPDLAQRYNVRAVPLTVIEDRIAIPGAVPEKALVEQLLKAVQSPAAQPSDVSGPSSTAAPQGPPSGEKRPGGSGLVLP